MPVGPPWMMQSSGYFFVGSKLAGLISTPSITVPSVLFHEITSRIPSVKPFTASVMRVSARGANDGRSLTKASFIDIGELAVNANFRPSRLSEKPPAIRSSGPVTRLIAPVAGSTRNKCELVFCRPEKYSPSAFHATKPGFSSNLSVNDFGVPPSAGTIASRLLLAKETAAPIALENTICLPSGDHCGLLSGPGCETSLVIVLSPTVSR
jgi:hypothetical protein